MNKYSAAERADVEMGLPAKPLSWSTFESVKKPREKYRTLQQFLRGDSDPIAVIVSGSPSIVVSLPDGLTMTKKALYDPSELGCLFLARGYRVLYIHQRNDPTPFTAELQNTISGGCDALLSKLSTNEGRGIQLASGTARPLLSQAIAAQNEAVERNYLLHVCCDLLEDYMQALRWTSQLIKAAGANVVWLFAWELPSHYFPGRKDEGSSRDSASSSSEMSLPFTSHCVEAVPALLISFRDECGVQGLLVGVAGGGDEMTALERARESMDLQDLDVVLAVCSNVLILAA